jgi:hypothetical protein
MGLNICMLNNFYFVGRLPARGEVGGVTTFTYNFATKFLRDKPNFHLIDLYDSPGKDIPTGVDCIFLKGRFSFVLIKLFVFQLKHKGVYFFNFSSVLSVVYFLLVPKRKLSKWIVVFHNGDQASKYINLNWFLKYFIKKGLSKFDRIGYLSSKQKDFFDDRFSPPLYHVSPYVVTGKNYFLKKCVQSKSKILVSGFPKKIYRILEILNVLQDLRKMGFEVDVVVCIYGKGDDTFINKIKHFVNENQSWVQIYSHLSADQFKGIMEVCDLYLRMNAVDSFGLVCAEAIDMGLDVIATNVCERYPGVNLIDVDDFLGLRLCLIHYLEGGDLSDVLNSQEPIDSLIPYDQFFHFDSE